MEPKSSVFRYWKDCFKLFHFKIEKKKQKKKKKGDLSPQN